MRNLSPLRYPGGKVSLARVIKEVLQANNLTGCTYVEPFAGGMGAGLKLLQQGVVGRVIINDLDPAIYSFWQSALTRTDDFIRRVKSATLNIEEWERQRDIYQCETGSCIKLGFATFYLNRCNRSGIIMNGGPIGGIEQKGDWKLDARFHRENLAARFSELAKYKDRIAVSSRCALDLISDLTCTGSNKVFCYIDPPYFVKGAGLYLNAFSDTDHAALADLLRKKDLPWMVTYDDVPRVHELYDFASVRSFRLRYSAHESSAEGGEVLISPNHVKMPEHIETLLATRRRNATKGQAPKLDRKRARISPKT